jgi:protein phosphatase PTC1
MESQKGGPIGVEGDASETSGKVSEADKIVSSTKQMIAEGTPAVGVSASNSGRGRDPIPINDSETFKPTALTGPVFEEPGSVDEAEESPKVAADAAPNLKPVASDKPTKESSSEAVKNS